MFSPRLGTVRTSEREEQNQWSHRADFSIDQRHESFGKLVEDRREGECLSEEEVAEMLGLNPDPSESHPHHEPSREPEEYDGPSYSDSEVEEMKTAEKYRKKYSKYWSENTKEEARELYHERRSDN